MRVQNGHFTNGTTIAPIIPMQSRGGKSKKRRKKSSQKSLELRLLFCGDASAPTSTASSRNRFLINIFAGLVVIWLILTVVTYSMLSSNVPMRQPMFVRRATHFISKQLNKHNALLRGGWQTASKLFNNSKMTPSLLERVPLIDMRELSATLPFDNPDGGAWKQGWDVQPVAIGKDKPPLKIFVVPHSHCDPGWIKTFDDYFQSQTKQIISSVVAALAKDPRRKFIWAEISYFEWWWREQNAEIQALTKKLLANNQLEFVTGGWVQPDEATTQLYAMEIQLQEGHDWIRNTFGEEFIPKYGWSIDPFGYSPTMAYLLKKYNFKAMLIQRVHYAIKKELALRQHLEFMWRQTWDEKGEYDIFCHVMPFFSYDVPHTCGPDPSICCQFDFARISPKYANCPWKKPTQRISNNNLKERALLLLDQYQKKAALYRSNVVIAPLGDDFRYQSLLEADLQYDNYQKIFDYINGNVDNVHIQFGTLSDYFEAAMGTFDPPLLKGSFFTYSDVNEDYWSGYYTSRIFDKALDRKLERVLFAASALGATELELQGPRRALSLFQHHDGVTGTAKDHVVQDYAKRIHEAIGSTQQWLASNIIHKAGILESLVPCWQAVVPRTLGMITCDIQQPIYLFNPLDRVQMCGDTAVEGKGVKKAMLPCDVAEPLQNSKAGIEFDPTTGLMTHPVKEEWMAWQDRKGGAYLFVPDGLQPFKPSQSLQIKRGGYIVVSDDARGKWKRKVVERKVLTEFGTESVIIDFIYETDMKADDHDWFVRFTDDRINNNGIFHTDLNGFNFDTHTFRSDLPIQSQVFPMPTLASIEDKSLRMTVLSEHAQGTASIEESSIDVWLDRRLTQDDNRGVGQGVMDNVPTQTRLRLLLEPQIYDTTKEFEVTPLCTRMWEELNHPLEMFGLKASVQASTEVADKQQHAENQYVVPFVYMVYKRVDFLKKAIESLVNSNFPRYKTPLIVSHDGHFEDMVSYVESLKDQGFKVIQIFHPYSCAEHPDTFPGADPNLNKDYKGDSYGNPRSASITCCKHHMTWLMKTVFDMDLGELKADHFLFMEEDYVVAPTIYSAIETGLRLIETTDPQPRGGFFGLTLDPTNAFTRPFQPYGAEVWKVQRFVSGPMVLPRKVFDRLRYNAKEYCYFDDYNWDWTIVHMQGTNFLPHSVLVPSRPQVLHIGFEGGMHEKNIKPAVRRNFELSGGIAPMFHGTKIEGNIEPIATKLLKGFGGWGHPADQEHCMKLLA